MRASTKRSECSTNSLRSGPQRLESLVPAPASGRDATTELLVSNVGEVADTYQLALRDLPEGWTATIASEELTVEAGSDGLAAITIGVPPEQRPGRSTFTVTATSTTDPDVSASADIAVVVRKAPRPGGGQTE